MRGRVCKACIGQRKEQLGCAVQGVRDQPSHRDKWLQRFQEGQPLSDRSRAPQRQAGRVSPEMEASIVQLRQQYPALGAEKLRKIMENRGGENLPCARNIQQHLCTPPSHHQGRKSGGDSYPAL
ncbi:MAG: helix-turn-helix domain-containing protein [Christensenellales bacterium]